MKLCQKFVIGSVMAISLAGCVDDRYDLSDVDTTVKIGAEQLVIPINIDTITMGSIINLKEDEIVKIVDGKYSIVKDGDFTSDNILVPEIFMPAPQIKSTVIPIKLTENEIVPMASRSDDEVSFVYEITSPPSSYDFKSTVVSDLIVSIDHIGCELDLTVSVALDGLQNYINRLTLEDVVLQLPKGLDMTDTAGGTYDATTGELKIDRINVNGTKVSLNLHANGVDMAKTGGVYDYGNSMVTISGSLYIKSGRATIQISDCKPGTSTLPSQVTLKNDYVLSDVRVTTFSGSVRYKIDKAELSDVSLDGMPDILSQSSTNLSFVNPRIFLSVENPLQKYDIYARTGLKIYAYHGKESREFAINNPWFQIGAGNASGIYNFCLSPEAASDASFPDAVHVGFTSLSNVLSGDGVPDRLSIRLVDPVVPAQRVSDFILGKSNGSLHGSYKFVAPLEFVAGSTVTYRHKIDGWHNDDLDYLTISSMEVEVVVSTDIPVGVKFTGYPIDVKGNRIEGVDIVGADIDANAKGQNVVIKVEGTVDGKLLDGIEFEAVATAAGSSALTPEMSVKLTKVRPKVSGSYIKEL